MKPVASICRKCHKEKGMLRGKRRNPVLRVTSVDGAVRSCPVDIMVHTDEVPQRCPYIAEHAVQQDKADGIPLTETEGSWLTIEDLTANVSEESEDWFGNMDARVRGAVSDRKLEKLVEDTTKHYAESLERKQAIAFCQLNNLDLATLEEKQRQGWWSRVISWLKGE